MDYKLVLGQLVSIWTTYISIGKNASLLPDYASLLTTIFPERDPSCHCVVHQDSNDFMLYKTPLGYTASQQLPDLMTLKNFIDGGYDVSGARILVCVKSIGPKKTGTTR
jgi:hypothetical protein